MRTTFSLRSTVVALFALLAPHAVSAHAGRAPAETIVAPAPSALTWSEAGGWAFVALLVFGALYLLAATLRWSPWRYLAIAVPLFVALVAYLLLRS